LVSLKVTRKKCSYNTRACQNHTRESHNRTHTCRNQTQTCPNHTRVEATFVRVVITLERIKTPHCVIELHSCVLKLHFLRINHCRACRNHIFCVQITLFLYISHSALHSMCRDHTLVRSKTTQCNVCIVYTHPCRNKQKSS
jgi:hypothetical protein